MTSIKIKISDPTINVNPLQGEETKDYSKAALGKFKYDLYYEEDDVAEKIIRVKRFSLPNNGQRWKVFNDNKVIFIIEGSKISKKEKKYLETVDGFNFIISQAKMGINSLNHFRNELKKII